MKNVTGQHIHVHAVCIVSCKWIQNVGLSDVYSGGTEVTVIGSDLNSVSEPRINLTVIIIRDNNDTQTSSSSRNETHSEVM